MATDDVRDGFAKKFYIVTDTDEVRTGAAVPIYLVNPEAIPGSGNVDSVFGRTGTVIAVAGDYSADLVTNAFDVTSDTSDDVPEGTTNLYNLVPSGGTTAQVLSKVDNTDYNLAWADPSGGGDMMKSVYDPTNVNGDAFDMDNMADGSSKVAMTTTERSNLADAFLISTDTSDDITEGSTNLFNVVPSGGTANQILIKQSGTNYDTAWGDASGVSVVSVFGRTGTVTAQTGDYTAAQVTNAFDTSSDDSDDISQGTTNLFNQVPTGGTTGQILAKASATNYDLEWVTDSSGGQVDSVAAGTNISVDNTDPTAPEVSVDITETLALNSNNVTGGATISATTFSGTTFSGTTFTGTTFNGVALTTSGTATTFLNGTGAYSTPLEIAGNTTDSLVQSPAAGQDGYVITWDNTEGEYTLTDSSNLVTGVFGRTGAVVATSGDYTAAQVTNAFDTSADTSDDVTEGTTNLFNVVPTGGTVNQILIKSSSTNFDMAWGDAPADAVTSVFGRTGAVVAVSGDYEASEVTNAFDTSADTSDDVTEGTTNLFNQVPSGGTADQILVKQSGTDYDMAWETASSVDTFYTANGGWSGSRSVTAENSGALSLATYNGTTSTYTLASEFTNDSSEISMGYFLGNGSGSELARSDIAITSAGMTVTDAIGSTGLEYAADYSTNFNDRSLVDKGFADGEYIPQAGMDMTQDLTVNGSQT